MWPKGLSLLLVFRAVLAASRSYFNALYFLCHCFVLLVGMDVAQSFDKNQKYVVNSTTKSGGKWCAVGTFALDKKEKCL
jgi:hypothetical protein